MEPTTAVANETTLSAVTDAARLRDAVYPQKIGAPNKATLPVLQMLRLRATEPGALWVEWTDLDIFSGVRVADASVERSGSINVPSQALYKILNGIPKKERPGVLVTIGTDESGETLHLDVGGVEYELHGLSGDESPEYPRMDGAGGTVSGAEVLTWKRRVAPFASTEESRPILNGIHLVTDDGDPRIEASNGHYAMTIRSEGIAGLIDVDVLLPRNALKHAQRIFDKDDEVLLTEAGENHFSLDSASAYVTTRRIEGPFPNMAQVHPSGTPALRATFERKKMETVLKRLDPVASSQTHKMGIEPDADGSLVLMVDSPDMGSARADVPAGVDVVRERTAGKGDEYAVPFRFGVNLSYLQQVLKGLNCDTVDLELWHPERAMLFRDRDKNERTALLMPLRLRD